jgi:DNA-binding HxlR family transcriptional regulator
MSTDEPACGLDVALAVMGGKWKPLILFHLRASPKRFGDLKRLVAGISEKVLIHQLRELVAAGVLVRHDYQQVPPKVDYTITNFGMTLVQALMPLCAWGTEHMGAGYFGARPHSSTRRAQRRSPIRLKSMTAGRPSVGWSAGVLATRRSSTRSAATIKAGH